VFYQKYKSGKHPRGGARIKDSLPRGGTKKNIASGLVDGAFQVLGGGIIAV
jgi:hypothetical protein